MIEYIKQREGLRLKNYYDLDSQILIGYGCNIRYNGKLSPEINAKQADSLLRIRFNKCLVIALKYESERKKKLITADKIFRYGELNFKKYFNYDN
jgi:GH24 family phage-related lysozyme (muramidase)